MCHLFLPQTLMEIIIMDRFIKLSEMLSFRTYANLLAIVLAFAIYQLVDAKLELRALRMQPPTVIHSYIPTPVVMDIKFDNPETLANKNFNPLNVKVSYNGQTWKGQIGKDKFNHVIFESWEYGIRAGALVLRSYAIRHNINTIDGIVERFCTSSHKHKYKKFLSNRLGLGINEKFNMMHRLPELLRAMVRYESGVDFPERYFVAFDLATAGGK